MAWDDKVNSLITSFKDSTIFPFSVNEVVGVDGVGWGGPKVIPDDGVVDCEFELINGTSKTVTVDSVSYSEKAVTITNETTLSDIRAELQANEYAVIYTDSRLVFALTDAGKTISECTHTTHGQINRGHLLTAAAAALIDVVNEFKYRILWETATEGDLTTNYPPTDYKLGMVAGELYVSDGAQWVKTGSVGFRVTGTTPPDNGSLYENSNILITCSQDVDDTTANGTNIILEDSLNGTVSCTYSVSGNVITINPDSNLSTVNTPHTLTITTGVKNVIGESLVSQYVITMSATAPEDLFNDQSIDTSFWTTAANASASVTESAGGRAVIDTTAAAGAIMFKKVPINTGVARTYEFLGKISGGLTLDSQFAVPIGLCRKTTTPTLADSFNDTDILIIVQYRAAYGGIKIYAKYVNTSGTTYNWSTSSGWLTTLTAHDYAYTSNTDMKFQIEVDPNSGTPRFRFHVKQTNDTLVFTTGYINFSAVQGSGDFYVIAGTNQAVSLAKIEHDSYKEI